MCTLIAIHRTVPGRWLVVGANRDEFFERPSEPPRVRTAGRSRVVCPLDLRAGGTWLGVGEQGVFAALTNLPSGSPNPTMKSRGAIVMDTLQFGGAAQAVEQMAELPERTYNPFNCYVADARDAFVVTYREVAEVLELSPGIHVIGNADAVAARKNESGFEEVLERDPRQCRVDQVEARVRASVAESDRDAMSALSEICRLHATGEKTDAVACIHASDFYGTKSSILLEMAERSEDSRLLYADQAPCQAEYEDFSSLLDELRYAPSYGSTESPMRITS